ncbi:hypothetical protein [Arthrobacter sp. 35W]|uniref:hypothetical protein n=1 Tax=Arthrobacter sp. 35W TaxID=1132441 RepID=UPI0003FCFE59|nr:hypothetical protein [Arthrobacter sp. 35W]
MGVAQLTEVTAEELGDVIRVEFVLDKSLPTHGSYLLGLMAASSDYSHQRRLSIEFMDGNVVDFSTFNHDQVDQEHHDHSGVHSDGTKVRASFPASSISGLGRGRIVTAYSHADGEEIQAKVPVATTGF